MERENMIRTTIATVMLVVALEGSAFAEGGARPDAEGYKCTIKRSFELREDGSIQPHTTPEAFRNMEFIVNRESGQMLGDISSRWWTGKREVLDRGSDQQSYKLIYTSVPPIVHVNLLQIAEYRKDALKPFLLVANTNMHTGDCTHLGQR
jgi:hypothetical protein